MLRLLAQASIALQADKVRGEVGFRLPCDGRSLRCVLWCVPWASLCLAAASPHGVIRSKKIQSLPGVTPFVVPHIFRSQAEGLPASSRWLSVPGTVIAKGDLWCWAKRYHRYDRPIRMHPGWDASFFIVFTVNRPRQAAIPPGWLSLWLPFRWCRFAQPPANGLPRLRRERRRDVEKDVR